MQPETPWRAYRRRYLSVAVLYIQNHLNIQLLCTVAHMMQLILLQFSVEYHRNNLIGNAGLELASPVSVNSLAIHNRPSFFFFLGGGGRGWSSG